MTKQQLLLICLMEECDEVSQRASKALRFGNEEIQPDQNMTNATRILYEFNDLVAVMELLKEDGVFTHELIDDVAVNAKKEKIAKYLKYSQELNIVK